MKANPKLAREEGEQSKQSKPATMPYKPIVDFSHLIAKLLHKLAFGFQLSVKGFLRLLWFSFPLLCDWFRRVAPFSQPFRLANKKKKRKLLALPALKAVCSFLNLVFTGCSQYHP